LLRWWKERGFGIEVVSEFEYRAALVEGFAPDKILLNGPAKYRWLPNWAAPEMHVNFDSIGELQALLPLAKQLDWSVGLRCAVPGLAKGKAEYPAHFGMTADEVVHAAGKLRRAGLPVKVVHFHCGTQITTPAVYARALAEVVAVCAGASLAPLYLDIGGGFPAPHVVSRRGEVYAARFALEACARVLAETLRQLPSIRELWMENGRFVSACAGVLVLRVLDIKEREDGRFLICDGGRTMNALISLWERHELFTVPLRGGPAVSTVLCGPTCMGFDQLGTFPLSARVRPGDAVVWMEAGAYHLPWETRFSHGHAAVLWHEKDDLTMVRQPQTFEDWWTVAARS
jgi:diaminopimelate decarboxylase